ncbi:hypothetical protein [Atlantibacter hermannii]|uniref:hypothetical protein n=1 Tax=Atlantibacter hermannii TaxID=565 RepID=UPI00289D9C25|nr:hypothetical protein [Atlantibacter hermannii]
MALLHSRSGPIWLSDRQPEWMVTDYQPYQHQLDNVSDCAKNKKTTGQGGFFASFSVRKELARLRSGRIMLPQIGTRNAFISYYDSNQCISS